MHAVFHTVFIKCMHTLKEDTMIQVSGIQIRNLLYSITDYS